MRALLALAPWATGGRVVGVALDGPTTMDPLVDAISDAVAGIDRAAGAIVVDARVDGEETLGAATARALGVGSQQAEDPPRIVASGAFDRHTMVLLLGPVSDADEGFAFGEALLAAASRRAEALAPVVVVAATGTRSTREMLDFRTGLPCCRLLEPRPAGFDLWLRYLHLRIAWEAAGSLERARTVEEALPQPLVHGEDEPLERALNSASTEMEAALPRELAGTAIPWIVEVATKVRSRPRPPEDLAEIGCAWTPPAGRTPQPAPWFARALLLRGPIPDERLRRFLRAAAICWPVAEELLCACVRVEASARARLPGVLLDCDEAGQREEEFLRGRGAAEFYPASSPLLPVGRAEFCSTAVLKRAARQHDGGFGRHIDMLHGVRNALAHGHSPGWRAVVAVDSLLSAIGG